MLKKCCMIVLLGLCVLTFSACSNSSSQKPATQANTDSNENTKTIEQPKTEEPKVETVEEQEITLNLAFGERTGTYTGEMKNGLPNGKGKFTTTNSEGTIWYYEGEFKDGHFNGKGETKFETGQIQSGDFQNELWNPNSFQIYEWLNSLKTISYSDTAKEFLETHTDFFPSESFDKISEFVDESIEYKMITKEPNLYGNKIIKLENAYIVDISANPIDFSTDKKYTYAICALNNNETQNVYELYFIGDMKDVFAEDTISTLYGIPLNVHSYQNVSGGYTNSIQLAVCYYKK